MLNAVGIIPNMTEFLLRLLIVQFAEMLECQPHIVEMFSII